MDVVPSQMRSRGRCRGGERRWWERKVITIATRDVVMNSVHSQLWRIESDCSYVQATAPPFPLYSYFVFVSRESDQLGMDLSSEGTPREFQNSEGKGSLQITPLPPQRLTPMTRSFHGCSSYSSTRIQARQRMRNPSSEVASD